MNQKNLNNRAGFSLVELMVVVAIIGILSTIAVPQFQKFQAKARQSAAKVELTGLYTAQSAFQAEYASYHGDLPYVGFVPSGYAVKTNGCLAQGPSGNVANAPVGVTRLYRVGLAGGNPQITGTTIGGSPNPNGMTATSWDANCQVYHYNANSGNYPVPTITGATALNQGQFTGYAVARISGSGQNDIWSISHLKVLQNVQQGY